MPFSSKMYLYWQNVCILVAKCILYKFCFYLSCKFLILNEYSKSCQITELTKSEVISEDFNDVT